MRMRPPAAGRGRLERGSTALACTPAIADARRGARSAPVAASPCVLETAWATRSRRGPGSVRDARNASCHWRRYRAARPAVMAPSASARAIAAVTVRAGARLTTGLGAGGGDGESGGADAARASVAAPSPVSAPKVMSSASSAPQTGRLSAPDAMRGLPPGRVARSRRSARGEQVIVHGDEPVDVVHVARELRHDDRVGVARFGAQPLDRGRVALGEGARLGVGARDLRREPGAERRLKPGRVRAARRAVEGVRAVDDEPAERHVVVGELAAEEDRLLDRLALRRGDDEERRRRVAEQRLDALRAFLEALDQAPERAEEDAEVVEQVDARQPAQHGEHDARPGANDLRREARRREEDLQRAPLEEAGEPVGRVEEVERVARRRRVEHEHVEAPGAVELPELRDSRELLRAGDRARELLVDAVAEHVVASRGVGRQARDELVERLLDVEHHRPQLALHDDAVAGEAGRVDEARLVAQLGKPERVRQALGGIDRHDRDAQARRREAHRQRGRGRRLADAARPRADHDALALQARSHTARSSARTSGSIAAASSIGAETNGSVTTGARARRRSRASWARCARARACAVRAARTGGDGGAVRSARTSAASKRSGSRPLATTRPTPTPTVPRSDASSASVSFTGISSGRATATTPVCAGSDSIASMIRPCRAMRPITAASANVRGAERTATPCPVAGASNTTRSYGEAPGVRRSSCASSHTLPTVKSSRSPGVAAAKYENPRLCSSTSASAREGSWSTRYSSIASSGSIEMWCRPGASSSSCTPVPPSTRETSSRRATSAMIVRTPRRAAASPSAAATVDLPTPPLPVTTTSGLFKSPAAAGRAPGMAAVASIMRPAAHTSPSQ